MRMHVTDILGVCTYMMLILWYLHPDMCLPFLSVLWILAFESLCSRCPFQILCKSYTYFPPPSLWNSHRICFEMDALFQQIQQNLRIQRHLTELKRIVCEHDQALFWLRYGARLGYSRSFASPTAFEPIHNLAGFPALSMSDHCVRQTMWCTTAGLSRRDNTYDRIFIQFVCVKDIRVSVFIDMRCTTVGFSRSANHACDVYSGCALLRVSHAVHFLSFNTGGPIFTPDRNVYFSILEGCLNFNSICVYMLNLPG